MKKIVCFIVCFSFVIGLFIPVSNIGKLYAASVKLEQALQWAITIANDDSHGYSQSNRWGNPDYDCSSFVISALKAAGFDVGGATYTQNMRSELTTRGFTWIPWSQIGSAANLRRGDILLNNSSITSRQHTEFYLGNNQNVGAHGPKGYPAPGDQTGNEISVSGYYDHPWTGVLRYKDDPLSISTVQVSLDSSSNEFRTGSDIPFQWTWGGAGATGYDLYIAKRIAGTVQYDWDNANRIYFAGNAVMSGVAGASLFKQGGEFAAYMRARNTSNGQYGGQSNFVYFVVKKGKAQWKIWISRTKMGSETEVVPVGKACYLCYQIIDKDTQKNWDVLYKSNYKVKESIAKPNGAIAHSYTYTNDNNWIAITPEETGEYKGIVDISGDFTGKLECSFMVKNFYYGDINNDGDITVTDLSMVNQAVNNPQILTADQRKRADVNADGAITKEDVTWIQQYVLGVIQEFPAESHVHNYSSKITKKATCSSTGVRTYSCICGESYTVTLPKTSHTPATDPAVEATCTRDGKTQGSHCSVCGTILTAQKTVKATGHVHTEVRNARAATTLSYGYTGDIYCKDCGVRLSVGQVIEKIQSEIGEGAGDSHEKYLEPGDMLYDASGKAEYEVIKVTGNTVYVSYNAVINKKQKVITVPNQIRTKEGIRCKVTAVSEGAFYNAKEVKQIVLDSQITKIGARAFNGCKKLTSLTIKSGKITSKTLSGNAFKGVSSKTKVKVPKAKKSSYKKLFYKKGLSKKVKFINM